MEDKEMEKIIKVSEAVCGDFTFTHLGGGSMLIEKRARSQSLTIDEGEAELLVDILPKALNLFVGEGKRRKGHWKDNGNGTISCSLCGTWFPREREPYLNFCGCCDAEMLKEGEQE